MRFAELRYRNCGWCQTIGVAMNEEWSSQSIVDATFQAHSWAAFSCPRCGKVTLVELLNPNRQGSNSNIHSAGEVYEIDVLPRAGEIGVSVHHLPDDVAEFFADAQRALMAGLPDAAAVQLRKTMEAAAAHKGITERNLVNSIKKLVDAGYVTLDFKDVMTHIRKIGNSGAHYTNERLTAPEVQRSLRFTTQVLRNLFEVPGELAELAAETTEAESGAVQADSDSDDPAAPTTMRL